MRIDELESHERLAMGGLIRVLIRLDGDFSEEEEARMNEVADAVGGRDLLWKAISDSAQALRDDDAVREAAKKVGREEARRFVLDVLTDIARAGTITAEEQKLLDWLESAWGLAEA